MSLLLCSFINSSSVTALSFNNPRTNSGCKAQTHPVWDVRSVQGTTHTNIHLVTYPEQLSLISFYTTEQLGSLLKGFELTTFGSLFQRCNDLPLPTAIMTVGIFWKVWGNQRTLRKPMQTQRERVYTVKLCVCACMVPCYTDVPSRVYSHLTSGVPGIDSGSTMTLNGIKWLLKIN